MVGSAHTVVDGAHKNNMVDISHTVVDTAYKTKWSTVDTKQNGR